MAINERLYTRVYWNLNNAYIYYLVIPSTNKREVERIKTICTFVLFYILLENILILKIISEYVEEQNIMQRCGKTWKTWTFIVSKPINTYWVRIKTKSSSFRSAVVMERKFIKFPNSIISLKFMELLIEND